MCVLRQGGKAQFCILSESSANRKLSNFAAAKQFTASDPFPPLPSEFRGRYLALRFRFYYNPTKEEIAPAKPTASALTVK